MEWIQKPGKMTVEQRIQFDSLIAQLHTLMVGASVEKLEVEEETVE
jgi:hypothetical protein